MDDRHNGGRSNHLYIKLLGLPTIRREQFGIAQMPQKISARHTRIVEYPCASTKQRERGRTMAEIILVHGIDQQQQSADKLESQWVPCLAGGVRTAGFPEVADRLWRNVGNPGGIETRMSFYGDLFLNPGQQGDDPGEYTAAEAEFAGVGREWLTRTAERATKQKVREIGRRELAYVTKQSQHFTGKDGIRHFETSWSL
jgi:hypothetical protein